MEQKENLIVKRRSSNGLKKMMCFLSMTQHNLMAYFAHTGYKIFCNHVGILGLSNHLELFRKFTTVCHLVNT